jgi:hypothetical protein
MRHKQAPRIWRQLPFRPLKFNLCNANAFDCLDKLNTLFAQAYGGADKVPAMTISSRGVTYNDLDWPTQKRHIGEGAGF